MTLQQAEKTDGSETSDSTQTGETREQEIDVAAGTRAEEDGVEKIPSEAICGAKAGIWQDRYEG